MRCGNPSRHEYSAGGYVSLMSGRVYTHGIFFIRGGCDHPNRGECTVRKPTNHCT